MKDYEIAWEMDMDLDEFRELVGHVGNCEDCDDYFMSSLENGYCEKYGKMVAWNNNCSCFEDDCEDGDDEI